MSNVVDLTSTSSSKFSHHLIVHLPHAAFRSNAHAGKFRPVRGGWHFAKSAGHFVSQFLHRIREERLLPVEERSLKGDLDCLFVRVGDDEEDIFVDEGWQSCYDCPERQCLTLH